MINQIKNNCTNHSKITVLIFFFISVVNSIEAQFNTEIGYTMSYMSAKSFNSLIDAYNLKQPMIKEMKNLNYIGGFNAGITFKTGAVKYGLFWESQTSKKTGTEGTLISSEPAKEKKLYFYFNSVSGGLAAAGKHFGLGTTVDYNFFRVKTNKTGVSNKIDVIKNDYFSSKIYTIIYFKVNQKVGIEFKPYFRIPWKGIDLDPLSLYLDAGDAQKSKFSDLMQFGLSFNILNGKQGD
ncbi:MAG: hypothetical protein ACM3PT_11595 [Deltaproteobacteria bacterium]